MTSNSINKIEGPRGNRLGMLRETDSELDDALRRPISTVDSTNRETDVKISKRLTDHGWDSAHIRQVLNKRFKRDELQFSTSNDAYFEGVLTDAGHRTRSFDSDDDDDSGVTTDSSGKYERFKNVTF